jgi:hypothetical protein
MDLRNMSDEVLKKAYDQAQAIDETDLVLMLKNELLRRDHSAHEETDPIHPMPGANWVWHPREPLITEKHSPRLWPPRQIKAQPVAPHNTAALLATLSAAKNDPLMTSEWIELIEAVSAQLRWYADSRTAGEVGY